MEPEYIADLLAQIEELQGKLKELTARLQKYEHPKNSHNSSIPTSKDENRPKKNVSLREKRDKKTCGQSDHEGKPLLMTNTPDKIKTYIPIAREFYGKSLDNIKDNPPEYLSGLYVKISLILRAKLDRIFQYNPKLIEKPLAFT